MSGILGKNSNNKNYKPGEVEAPVLFKSEQADPPKTACAYGTVYWQDSLWHAFYAIRNKTGHEKYNS